MRKTLLATLLIIPFFWGPSDFKNHSKRPVHPPAKVWNLPDAVKKYVTTSTVYKTVEHWVDKLWPF